MAFGSLDRARVPNVSGFGGAKIFNVELNKEDFKSIDRNVANSARRSVNEIQHQLVADRDLGIMTGVMPVVDRGELFFQDNVSVLCRMNLDSGLPPAGLGINLRRRSEGPQDHHRLADAAKHAGDGRAHR